MSVITAREFVERGAQNVQETLRYTAGVTAELYGNDGRNDYQSIYGDSYSNHDEPFIDPDRRLINRYIWAIHPDMETFTTDNHVQFFPLHSGRILDLPGRILVSALGLLIAALSATGVVIWARKRRSCVRQRRRTPQPVPMPAE